MKNFSQYFFLGTFLLGLLFLGACSGNKEQSLEYVDKGVELYYQSRFKEALDYFEKALEKDDTNFEAYFWIGNYYNNKRKYHRAIEYFNKAIRLNPGFAAAYANRGFAKNYLNDKKGACADWKKAQKLGKENLDNYLQWCE
jgi:tetratricopeptide (TPR) repeat protein